MEANQTELVVDSVTRTVRGESVSGQEIPFRLLEALLEADGGYIRRACLFEAAWQSPYLGRRDDPRVHYNLSRLRRMLGEPVRRPGLIERAGDYYRIAPGARVTWRRSAPEESADLMEWVCRRGSVRNRDVARQLGVSRATALRRLDELVAAGQLALRGRGRGARYIANRTIPPCKTPIL